jgi:hypothetical protein
MYILGTITRMMEVANKIPNPREIAMGINWYACLEVSRIMGVSPPKVVSVVNIIGRNLRIPASRMAS